MTGIEDRVRDSLHELGDSLPASTHPRADFERRLARRRARRWRAPLLVTAAAAVVVVAAVVVPVALRSDGGAGQDTGTAPLTTHPPSSDELSPGEPPVLGSYVDNGVRRRALLTFDNAGSWCVSPTYSPDETPIEATCLPIPAWPITHGIPGHESFVEVRGVLSGPAPHSGPLADVQVYVTAPEVTRLEVGDAAGDPVPVRLAEELPAAKFYVADFPETSAGFRYTAWNANGEVLESAIE
jgi:hypothetical protein